MIYVLCWLWIVFWLGHGVITGVGYVFTGDTFNPLGLGVDRTLVAVFFMGVACLVLHTSEDNK